MDQLSIVNTVPGKIDEYAIKNRDNIIEYYNKCWLSRFRSGHNPKSQAIHLGMFIKEGLDNDSAKLETNNFLIEQLNIPQNQLIKVADLGCGIGGTCNFLAARFPNVKVIGVNISQEQTAYAMELSVKAGLSEQVKYKTQDYCATDIEDAEMDFVFAIESIFHASDKKKVFGEAYRILNSAGTFAFIDYFQVRKTTNKEEENLIQAFNAGWGARMNGTGLIKSCEHKFEGDMQAVGFRGVQAMSLLKEVRQGITNSYVKARKKLAEGVGSHLGKHYKACIALNILVGKGIVDYKFVKAVK